MVFRKMMAFVKNPYNLINVLCFVALVTVLLVPTGETYAQSGNVYSARSVQSASPAMRGVLLQSREVSVEPQQQSRYAGGAVGATAGGALLSTVFGQNSAKARIGAGLIGAILGGLAGQQVADSIGGPVAIEYLVKLEPQGREQARVMAVTQPAPGPAIAQGSTVYLIQTRGTWRVLPAYHAADRNEMNSSRSEPQLAQEVLNRSYRYKTTQLDDYVAAR